MTDIILSTQNGEPVASSRQIAESFGKDHNHVMRDIKALEEGVSKNGQTPMFYKTEYTHEQNGQTYPMYLMNRDGFTLLAKMAKVDGAVIKENTWYTLKNGEFVAAAP